MSNKPEYTAHDMADGAAGVPEGWKLVPVEPTPEMLDAAIQDGICVDGKPVWKKDVVFQAKWKYQQMLAAAPAQPVVQTAGAPEVTRELAALAWQRAYDEGDDSGVDFSLRMARHVSQLLAAPAQPTQPALTVWEGAMPESNGKSNYTAVLMRKGDRLFDGISGGMTIARSEYPDRVRYEADCVRYLIGELQEEPCIIDYDADKHSGYRPAVQEIKP